MSRRYLITHTVLRCAQLDGLGWPSARNPAPVGTESHTPCRQALSFRDQVRTGNQSMVPATRRGDCCSAIVSDGGSNLILRHPAHHGGQRGLLGPTSWVIDSHNLQVRAVRQGEMANDPFLNGPTLHDCDAGASVIHLLRYLPSKYAMRISLIW